MSNNQCLNVRERDEGVYAAIHAVGSINILARALGINPSAVSRWPRVPANRVQAVHQLTGVPLAVLRSDLFTEEK